jgi:hypothetical protein
MEGLRKLVAWREQARAFTPVRDLLQTDMGLAFLEPAIHALVCTPAPSDRGAVQAAGVEGAGCPPCGCGRP